MWQISVSLWGRNRQPVPVLRWSPAQRADVLAARDQVMRGLGTDEAFYEESMVDVLGPAAITCNWRKPLRLDEITRLAPTPDVRARPGRP